MKKITTEDCIAFLNKVNPGNWKRKSKTGNASTGIRRVFADGDRTEVVLETNGVLSVIGYVTPSVKVVETDVKIAPLPTAPLKEVILGNVELPEGTLEKRMAIALKEAIIPDKVVKDFMRIHFGDEPTNYDYKVVAAAITLRAILPPSFATTAIIKAMRGTAKAKAGQSNPAFGVVAGMPKYKTNDLWRIVEDVQALLMRGDVMEKEDLITDEENQRDYAPCFLTEPGDTQHRVNKTHCLAVAQAFTDCGARFGKVEPEPERKKISTIKPDELLEKLKKSGVWAKAEAKAANLIKKFKSENKEWDEYWYADSGKFHGKSFKNDIITMSFWAGETVELKNVKYEDRRMKAPILTSRWTEAGDLIDWDVKVQDVNPRY